MSSGLQHTATYYSTAIHYNRNGSVAPECQADCNTLQHTETHYITTHRNRQSGVAYGNRDSSLGQICRADCNTLQHTIVLQYTTIGICRADTRMLFRLYANLFLYTCTSIFIYESMSSHIATHSNTLQRTAMRHTATGRAVQGKDIERTLACHSNF